MFLTDKVAMGQIHLREFQRSFVSIISPVFMTHSHIQYRRYNISENDSVIELHASRRKISLWDQGQTRKLLRNAKNTCFLKGTKHQSKSSTKKSFAL
jgi:hypothetical protein